MILLSFDFHYIDDPEKYPNGGVYPVSVENFEKQLDKVAKHFKFVSQKEILDAIEGKGQLPEKCCLLTFDDGLRSQYEKAVPILLKKKIPAVFFINTMPTMENRVCLVHKIHWLRSSLPREVFLGELREALISHGIRLDFSESFFEKAQAKHRYDNKEDAAIKFLLNYWMDNDVKREIVDDIFKKYIKDEKVFAKAFYMDKKQIKKLAKMGFVGGHTYDHEIIKSKSYKEILENIALNKNNLESITGEEIYSFAYPFGSKFDVTEEIVRACRENGYKIGITKERAFNTTLEEPLLLARLDTNDIMGGKRPMFSVDIHGNLEITDKQLTEKRIAFFEEK